MSGRQLELFPGAGEPPRRSRATRSIEPAAVMAEDAAASHCLPLELRLGTSSWSFPGWAGIVYRDAASAASLSQHGLVAYAKHPLLRTVGIDRTYYAPMTTAQFAAHAEQVPDEFRFLVKAHEALTIVRWPDHARYGARRGFENGLFLDVEHAKREVVDPFATGLREKAGPLLFQFAPQDVSRVGGDDAFVDRLHRFLRALPRGPLYAVELRNAELLTERYRDALADVGAVHCLNVHGRMPPLPDQWSASGAGRGAALVIRWMLHPTESYETALERYAPFDRLVDEDPTTRRQIALLAIEALETGQPAFVVVNNKAEGSSPYSVFRLAHEIARRVAPGPPA